MRKKMKVKTQIMRTNVPFFTAFAALPAMLISGEHTTSAENFSGTAGKPNILFCIADDASFHHFSNSGCRWVSTPNFDRIADEGISFRRCYTPNAKSAPSRAIVLTGRYSWQLKEAGNHVCNFPADIKVFTEVLSGAGYDVAYTGKGWGPGNPGVVDGKPRKLTGEPYQKEKCEPPTKAINKCDYAGNFKDFLDDNAGRRPWFFWFGSHEPHRKYVYGSGISSGDRSIDDIDEVPPFWADNETTRTDMLDYGYEIEYFDSQIGKMLDELERRGMLSNTVVIVTSDNGMPFPRCKANNYEYSTHMPFAMMWLDGIKKPGRDVSSYVSFIDIAPTVLDLAGIDGESEGMCEIFGRSLRCFIEDNVPEEELERRREIILGRERDDYGRPANQGYPIRAIMSDNMMLIWNLKPWLMPAGNPETGYMDVDGSPTKTAILDMYRNNSGFYLWNLSFGPRPEYELYDIEKDPYCMNNLAEESSMQDIVRTLSLKLEKCLASQGDPRMVGDGDVFDRYPFDKADKWNFYERVMSGELEEPWNSTGWVTPSDYEIYKDNRNEGHERN